MYKRKITNALSLRQIPRIQRHQTRRLQYRQERWTVDIANVYGVFAESVYFDHAGIGHITKGGRLYGLAQKTYNCVAKRGKMYQLYTFPT